MLSRTVQRFIVSSTQFHICKDATRNTSFVTSIVMFLGRQQPIASAFSRVNLHVSACQCQKQPQKFPTEVSEDIFQWPVEPEERGKFIDQESQQQIDKMILENPEIEKLRQVIEMEIVLGKQQGDLIPENVKPRHWLELLKHKNRQKRKFYLEFLFKVEQKRLHRKALQQEKYLELEKIKTTRAAPGAKTEFMEYGIGRNAFTRRINALQMNHVYNWNSLRAIMYGRKIIFDCCYEEHMNSREIKNCAKQIMNSFSINRQHDYCYNVYLCNVNFQGLLIKEIYKLIPSLFDPDFPWTITSKSYLEIFEEKNKLVYLSGHSKTVLETYDPNSVYIIGAFVDKSCQEPISFGKAKELGIRSVKLPLDHYLHFGDGSGKNLTLNQMLGIMLDIQCDNWKNAFDRHVPKRKLFESRLKAMERRMAKQFENKGQNVKLQTIDDKIESDAKDEFSFASRLKHRNSWNKN